MIKRLLHELDEVKTPDGWAEEVIVKAKNLSPDEAKNIIPYHKKKLSFKIVIVVAALVTISSTSIFAAYKINQTYKSQNTAQSMNHFDSDLDVNGNPYTFDGGQIINQSKINDNLNITCTKMSAESHSAYIVFNVSTKDGTPLVENCETKVSIAARQTFQNVVVKVDDQILGGRARDSFYHLQRVDDASQPDKAVFELNLQTQNLDLSGKSISVSLENYQDEWYEYEDIGFKFATIADLVKQGMLASVDEFLPSDKKTYSLDQGMRLLKAGSNKIYFSDKYPEAYIDNMGFAPNDLVKGDCFYLTIVPGTEENATALKKLIFQNLTTGMPNTLKLASQTRTGNDSFVCKEETLPDGRIEIALSARRDDMYNPGGYKDIDTTMEMLSNYTLKYNKTSDNSKDIRYVGKWTFDFNVNSDEMDAVIDKDINVSVTETRTNTQTIVAKHVNLTTSNLTILSSIENLDTWSFKEFAVAGPISSPYIILKDGTKISAGYKAGGSYQDGESTVTYNWILSSLVDPSQVESIEWYGVPIDLQ